MKICYEPASQAKASVLMSNKRNLRHLYFLLLFYFVFSSVFTRISAFMDWIRANARKVYPDRSNVTQYSLDLSGYAYGLNTLKRYEDALKQLNLSLAANPRNTDALEEKRAAEEGIMRRRARELNLKGNDHLHLYEYDKALECYEQALILNPNNRLAKNKLTAEKSLESAQKKVIEYFTKGNESYARNDFNKAIEYYKLAFDNSRHDRKGQSSFLAFQAMSFNKLANHTAALTNANEALSLDSTNKLAQEQKLDAEKSLGSISKYVRNDFLSYFDIEMWITKGFSYII